MRTVDSTPRLHRDDPVRGVGAGPDGPAPSRWSARRASRRRMQAAADTPQGLIEQVLARGHLGLFFPQPLEQTFQHDIAASRRRLMLVCALVGIATFWVLSMSDAQMLASLGHKQAQGRHGILGIMVSSLVFALLMPGFGNRNWHYEALTFLNTMAINATLVAAGRISADVLVLTHTQAVVLVLMYAALAARQRFWWSLASVVITATAYMGLVEGKTPALQQIVDQNIKFILVAFTFTLACNYLFERGERRAWLLRQLDIHKRAALVDTQDRLRLLSHCDALTGLFNRRRFMGDLDAAWRNGLTTRHPLAVLMLDVDHFKLFNDTYGHPAGDACLVSLSELLRQHVDAEHGVVARMGGEEFAVLLHPCTAERAMAVARQLCEAVKALGIEHRASPVAACVTVSIGVGIGSPESANGPADLIAAADQALYRAKAQGRNGIDCAAPTASGQGSGSIEGGASAPSAPPSDASWSGQAALQLTADDLETLLEKGHECARFPSLVEAAYEQRRAPGRRRHLFMVAWLGLICINAYTFHSRSMFTDLTDHQLYTFLGISGVLGALTPLLLCPLQGWLRELLYTEGICAAAVLSSYLLSFSDEITTLSYATSLFFLPLFSGLVGRQTVWHTGATSLVVLGSALFFLQPADARQALVLRDTIVLVAVACLYIMIAAYNLDRADRRQWVLRQLERLRHIELEEASRALHELSMKDPLTGLANRRRFEAECARAWSQAARHEDSSVALLLIDIDHFKRFNDGYGHPAGDRCLQGVAQILDDVAESADGLAVRLGGEEFAILLPRVTPEVAAEVAEEICVAIRASNVPHDFSLTDSRLTVSVGLAMSGSGLHGTSALLSAADRALYQAKRGGRNSVMVYQGQDMPVEAASVRPAPPGDLAVGCG
ncbi:MAG: GGDEF domain-containing protein [Rubrivivax sp.]|nr:MAG: GGDEF domain-containing protein [Rubrivivax sp.]